MNSKYFLIKIEFTTIIVRGNIFILFLEEIPLNNMLLISKLLSFNKFEGFVD